MLALKYYPLYIIGPLSSDDHYSHNKNSDALFFFGNYTAVPTAPFTERACGGIRGSLLLVVHTISGVY